MNENQIGRRRNSERGIALLLALFVLMLLSAVGVALILAAGTESSVAGNYRVSTVVVAGSQGGLEEGRERLMPASPDTLVPCPDTAVQAGCTGATPAIAVTNRILALATDVQQSGNLGGALILDPQGFFNFNTDAVAGPVTGPAAGKVLYILNPAPGEVVNPTNQAPANPYRDTQYAAEWGVNPPTPASMGALQSSFGAPGTAAAYVTKWVRVTQKTEFAANADYDANGTLDNTLPVFFDANLNRQRLPCCSNAFNPACTPIATPAAPPCWGRDEMLMERDFLAKNDATAAAAGFGKGVAAVPVYQVTALAVTPTGARRMVQYEVARQAAINAAGAIVSQAPVTTNGNFGVFGSYPFLVNVGNYKCGKVQCTNINLCAIMDPAGKGNIIPMPPLPSNAFQAPPCPCPTPQPPQCCGATPCKDFCGVAPPVDAIASGGSITINGNNSTVPDTTSGCSPNQTCVYTTSPQVAADQNTTIPFDINQMVASFSPPVGTPVETIPGMNCSANGLGGNNCKGTGVQIGTLPATWLPAYGTAPPYPGNQQMIVYADGDLQLQGQSSGSGVLVVDGNLDIGSGFQWFGLIIVKGIVSFSGVGGSATNILGSVIAGQNLVNNTVLGGGVNIIYDSCAYRDNSASEAFRILSFRELLENAR